MAETTVTKAPTAIKTIISNDSSQRIQFMDNGSMTIREFNGAGQSSTYVCLDRDVVQSIRKMLSAKR